MNVCGTELTMHNTSSAGRDADPSNLATEQYVQEKQQEQTRHPDAVDDRVGLVQQFPDPKNKEATRDATVE